ncbi:zinc finger protein 292a [Pimephales promelas]|nr:zinc finger protein 292a [Pimephales promelas]KAG1925806.1 zinc finger protein 292a [Pimephales promelas]
MSDEQSILKHYTTHGLTEQYIEDQRSQFIFCMKSSAMPRADSTSKNIEVEQTVFDEHHTENGNVSPQDVGPDPVAEVLRNESFTATTIPVVKRKRGRPRKNPLKIENVKNVKIVMYENLSSCSELLLKQLQDMQPMVILDKGLHS